MYLFQKIADEAFRPPIDNALCLDKKSLSCLPFSKGDVNTPKA